MTWHQLPRGNGASSPSALTLAAVVTLAALGGCGEGGPAGPEERLEDQAVAPPGLSISDPIAADQGLAYVSASPGSFPDAESVVITNLANGASASASILDGGFDPVAIAAEPSQELQIVVRFADGTTASFLIRLPMRRPPRVVRTRPPKGETDVVLNVTATVVFSEPVDSNTVNDRTVQLRLDGEPVDGILTLAEDGLRAKFVPAEPLQPGSQYTLLITQGVLDLSGDPLEEEVQATFTTATTASPRDIVFLSNPYGDWDIHGVNADGSGRVNLTGRSPGDEGDPAWSPDGSKIAFTSRRDGNAEIYLMNADGTGPVRLTNSPLHDKIPVWSADGSRIAFISMLDDGYRLADVDIYVMFADGSRRVKVNAPDNAWFPAWSPHGSRIAFAALPDTSADHLDIYVVNADGIGGLVNVTNSYSCEEFPKWSPDGSKIAFRSQHEDISLMNPDGSGAVRLTNMGVATGSYAWSPDGSKIAFVSRRDGNAEIYVVNADGTGQANLTNAGGSDEEDPAWSPDGSKIAFTSSRDGNPEIYLMSADGTGWVRLTKSPADDISPEWRPQR